MLGKIVTVSAAVGVLSGVSVPTERYKMATLNGEDFYQFEVSGASQEFYDVQLAHWGNHMCPDGYRVSDAGLAADDADAFRDNTWVKVTVACPTQSG